jgi:peptidoglycan/LPS O-acetylase OafA/YrhL
MAQTESIQAELARRHRTAAMVTGALLGLTIALCAIAFVYSESLHRPGDPSLAMALWIAIFIFGLGSFVLRRTRFQSARLQDIAGLRGLSGLLAALQSTTIQVALIGGAIALMGFLVMIMTGNRYDMLRAGGVAAIVLLYVYPQRSAWQRLVRAIEQQSGDADAASEKGMAT